MESWKIRTLGSREVCICEEVRIAWRMLSCKEFGCRVRSEELRELSLVQKVVLHCLSASEGLRVDLELSDGGVLTLRRDGWYLRGSFLYS